MSVEGWADGGGGDGKGRKCLLMSAAQFVLFYGMKVLVNDLSKLASFTYRTRTEPVVMQSRKCSGV